MLLAPSNGVASSFAIAECVVEYTGHTAHAAGAPWEAINAQVRMQKPKIPQTLTLQHYQDAAVLAYTNISALRQQTNPTHRIHGIIINENWVQNGRFEIFEYVCIFHLTLIPWTVIPGSSKVVFGVRAPTMAEVEILKLRVEKCFAAAAHATG